MHLGALPQDLVASELFGHEKGAFTGATERYQGSFEQANGGTVFLDEISTISEKVQISLLRLLEAREFYRMGGRRSIKSDVRVIAASNEDLQDAVNRGAFRKDLYFRLEVLQIRMPPLRERHGDMLLLMEHFIKNKLQPGARQKHSGRFAGVPQPHVQLRLAGQRARIEKRYYAGGGVLPGGHHTARISHRPYPATVIPKYR